MGLSNLEVINLTDSVPYPNEVATLKSEEAYKFYSHDNVWLGLVLPIVAVELEKEPWIVTVDNPSRIIKILSKHKTLEDRTSAFGKLLEKWRVQQKFHVLKGWRNELYTVYNPTHTPYLLIERSGSCLFGLVTYGVHIVGYVPNQNGVPEKIWVPRRSHTKPTFPGMLDNTVAGGIGYPYGRMATVIKECMEEAGLPEDYVTSHVKPSGVVSYYFRKLPTLTHEDGVYQPEVEYLYDLVMDDGVVPTPVDGEVQMFQLMTIKQVQDELAKGTFKYNTGLVTIDFLIRHGFITPEDEPDYFEIVSRMHRRLEFPVM